MKKLIIILLLFTSVLQAQTTYRVSSGLALNTMIEVNALNLVAGDSVLFNRSESWVVAQSDGTDCLIITESGNASDSIYFGAYGTGDDPIITGRQSVSGWNTSGNWTNVSGNIWSYTGSLMSNLYQYNNRGRLWLDGTEAVKYPSNDTYTPNVTYPWTHNGTTLYVYATENPATFYSNIESVGVYPAVAIISGDYIKIEGIDFRGGGNMIQYNGSDHLTINDCKIGRDCGQSGLMPYFGGTAADYVTISNTIFDTYDHNMDTYEMNNTEDGIIITDGCNDWEFSNNTCIGWGHTSVNIGPVSTAATNIKIHHNTFSCPDSDYGRAFTYNIGSAIGVGNCTGNEIHSNYLYDHATKSQISGDGLKFYNNIIDGVRGVAYRAGIGDGLSLESYAGQVNNNEIYNNVIANAADNGLLIKYGTQGTHDNIIKNNIFINNTLYQVRYEFSGDNGEGIGSQTFQNNLFYSSTTTDVIFYEKMASAGARPMTVAEFNAMNGITTGMTAGEVADVIQNNINGDPLFVDPDNANYLLRDYNLSVGSPAISAGIGVGLTTDYAGNAWATTPSIGSLEYDSSPPSGDLPTIETTSIAYKSVDAIAIGNVTSAGGGTISERGIVWGTSANPTVSNFKQPISGTTGSFTVTLRGLTANTTYHYRAYAINESGTSYGADQTFTTKEYIILKDTKVYKVGNLTIVVQ